MRELQRVVQFFASFGVDPGEVIRGGGRFRIEFQRSLEILERLLFVALACAMMPSIVSAATGFAWRTERVSNSSRASASRPWERNSCPSMVYAGSRLGSISKARRSSRSAATKSFVEA